MRVRKSVLLLMGLLLGVAGLSAAFTDRSGLLRPTRDVTRRTVPVDQLARRLAGGVPLGLQVAVDGAINPEAIPDERAWGHFLSAMADADVKTRDVALKKAGLDLANRAAFSGALGSLGDELAAAMARGKAGESPELVRQHQQMAVANTRSRLQRALSAAAQAQLEQYVQTEVKRRIKIYRGPAVLSNVGGAP